MTYFPRGGHVPPARSSRDRKGDPDGSPPGPPQPDPTHSPVSSTAQVQPAARGEHDGSTSSSTLSSGMSSGSWRGMGVEEVFEPVGPPRQALADSPQPPAVPLTKRKAESQEVEGADRKADKQAKAQPGSGVPLRPAPAGDPPVGPLLRQAIDEEADGIDAPAHLVARFDDVVKSLIWAQDVSWRDRRDAAQQLGLRIGLPAMDLEAGQQVIRGFVRSVLLASVGEDDGLGVPPLMDPAPIAGVLAGLARAAATGRPAGRLEFLCQVVECAGAASEVVGLDEVDGLADDGIPFLILAAACRVARDGADSLPASTLQALLRSTAAGAARDPALWRSSAMRFASAGIHCARALGSDPDPVLLRTWLRSWLAFPPAVGSAAIGRVVVDLVPTLQVDDEAIDQALLAALEIRGASASRKGHVAFGLAAGARARDATDDELDHEWSSRHILGSIFLGAFARGAGVLVEDLRRRLSGEPPERRAELLDGLLAARADASAELHADAESQAHWRGTAFDASRTRLHQVDAALRASVNALAHELDEGWLLVLGARYATTLDPETLLDDPTHGLAPVVPEPASGEVPESAAAASRRRERQQWLYRRLHEGMAMTGEPLAALERPGLAAPVRLALLDACGFNEVADDAQLAERLESLRLPLPCPPATADLHLQAVCRLLEAGMPVVSDYTFAAGRALALELLGATAEGRGPARALAQAAAGNVVETEPQRAERAVREEEVVGRIGDLYLARARSRGLRHDGLGRLQCDGTDLLLRDQPLRQHAGFLRQEIQALRQPDTGPWTTNLLVQLEGELSRLDAALAPVMADDPQPPIAPGLKPSPGPFTSSSSSSSSSSSL